MAAQARGQRIIANKPFSNFRQAMHEMPALRDQWFKFHETEPRKAAEEWLKAKGIEAELWDATPLSR